MTRSRFIRSRAYGQIQPTARVRTVVWRFPGCSEWEEIFVDEQYETIEQQEARFRSAMGYRVQFLTLPADGASTPTVEAQNWRE